MIEIGSNLSATVVFASLFWACVWALSAYFNGGK